MLKVKNVNDYSAYLGHSAQHRWVSVIDYAEVTPIRHSLCNYSVYGLFLRDDILIDLTYGLGKYDYNKGTLICVAPGQIGGKEDDGERVEIEGWALLFHPDILLVSICLGRIDRPITDPDSLRYAPFTCVGIGQKKSS